nr:integrase, catalytic region, zinc finger, CCHC-type, peptidase aspartic, catalytic [Tanacetum cinerariifolium]
IGLVHLVVQGNLNSEQKSALLAQLDQSHYLDYVPQQDYRIHTSDLYAQSLEIDNLKHTLSEHLKEKKSLEQIVTLLIIDFHKKESRNIDRELALEKQAQLLEPKLYDGSVIQKTNAIVIHDFEETLMLEDESHFKMLQKQKDPTISVPRNGHDHHEIKERIQSLNGNLKKEKIKKELEEIETINIKLDHRVTKLITENEHLKKTYKQLYDSIKSLRLRSKEQCDALIKQVNTKSAENYDLNASLQEKALVITALKDTLSKLKGKAVVDEVVTLHPIDPELLRIDVAPLAPKLRNNRTAHYDYLKHTQEEIATLRKIVKNERLLNPLNTSLDYSCKYTKRIQELLIILKQTCPCINDLGNVCPLTRITTTAIVPLRKPIPLESNTSKPVVVQIILWYLDSGCSKHMTGDRSQLINFVHKFLGTVKFGNDHVAKIMGYGDYKIGNVTILRV